MMMGMIWRFVHVYKCVQPVFCIVYFAVYFTICAKLSIVYWTGLVLAHFAFALSVCLFSELNWFIFSLREKRIVHWDRRVVLKELKTFSNSSKSNLYFLNIKTLKNC